MKTTKIKIKNLFGIKEIELDGGSVELTGSNGTGKSSVLDAIKFALTNASDRDYIVRDGEKEGEILIETDTGLEICRKKRTDKSDYKSIKDGKHDISSPESFLKKLFTPLQLNPVEFLSMSKNDQNRAILDLIDFKWDMDWIREQFGEIPTNIDYSKNILQVLSDIQSEKGDYFQERQNINRDVRNKKAFADEIRNTIPPAYDPKEWEAFDIGEKYEDLYKAEDNNSKIQRAKMFEQSLDGKLREIDANESASKYAIKKKYDDKKMSLTSSIERMKSEIKSAEHELETIGERMATEFETVEAKRDAEKAKLSHDMQIAHDYSGKDFIDVDKMKKEIEYDKKMIAFAPDYKRMMNLVYEASELQNKSDEITDKIEKARTLPGEILKEANIPVEGLTVENGVPLVHGLPVSNLSEGEKLSLCVDIASANPSSLSLILLDGVEKLSEDNRKKLYEKCKEKGLQFIATRTTDSSELIVTEL